MYGHLKGFLGFLDLLAEGERRRAELIAGRHFEPERGRKSRANPDGRRGASTTRVEKSKAVRTYSTIHNTGLAAVLVAALAGIVSNGLALDQRVIYERDILGVDPATVLPEIVVTARRLES